MTGRVLSVALAFAFGGLTVALIACLLRVLRGPSLPDRVLALDLMTITGAGLMAVTTVAFEATVLLDVALLLIVTGFVGTAAFAQFIERQRGSTAPPRSKAHTTTRGIR